MQCPRHSSYFWASWCTEQLKFMKFILFLGSFLSLALISLSSRVCVTASDDCNINNGYYIPAKDWVRFINERFTQEPLTNDCCSVNTQSQSWHPAWRENNKGWLISTLNCSHFYFLDSDYRQWMLSAVLLFFSVFLLVLWFVNNLVWHHRSLCLLNFSWVEKLTITLSSSTSHRAAISLGCWESFF